MVVFFTVVIPFVLLLLIISRLLTTFFHELGHAIPALLLTGKKIDLFLGSYGDEQKSYVIKITKLLNIYVMMNPLKWRKGMIKHNYVLGTEENLIILFLGPLFSIIIAVIALTIIFFFDLNGFLKLFTILFLLSAIYDLRNLYPYNHQIKLDDGSYTYCDGYKIFKLLKFRKESDRLLLAARFYENGDYLKASKLFSKLDSKFLSEQVFDKIVNSFIKNKKYQKAQKFCNSILNLFAKDALSDTNLCNIALVFSYLNENDSALEFYNKAVELNPQNISSLCNRGYTYNLIGKYNEAMYDFNKVIDIDAKFSYAYSNRALSNINLGRFEEAKADLAKSLAFNEKDSYAHRNFGLYYFKLKIFDKAMEQLMIAKNIDPTTHMIDKYIEIVDKELILQALLN